MLLLYTQNIYTQKIDISQPYIRHTETLLGKNVIYLRKNRETRQLIHEFRTIITLKYRKYKTI